MPNSFTMFKPEYRITTMFTQYSASFFTSQIKLNDSQIETGVFPISAQFSNWKKEILKLNLTIPKLNLTIFKYNLKKSQIKPESLYQQGCTGEHTRLYAILTFHPTYPILFSPLKNGKVGWQVKTVWWFLL